MKMMWNEPQITEIKIEMTQFNKIGRTNDGHVAEELCGDKVPCECS